LANDVQTLAANNGGTLLYHDINDLAVGEVTVLDGLPAAMTVTGIATSDDDTKLVVDGDLTIERPIDLVLTTGGDLLLDVAGDLSQSGTGTITARGLALMVDGTTTLDLANDVQTLAANNGGTLLYHDINDLAVGEVTVLDGLPAAMTVTGVTSLGDVDLRADGKLTVPNLAATVREVSGNDVDFTAMLIVLDSPTIAARDIVGDPGEMRFHSPVELAASTTVEAIGTGAIDFTKTLTSEMNEANAIQLNADAGDIFWRESVGAGGRQLGAITIDNARNVTATSTIQAASLVQQSGTGTTRLMENVTTTAPAGVNLTTTGAMGMIALDGLTINTGVGLARLNAPTILEDSSAITTAGGAITFTSRFDSQSDENNSVTLSTGTGNIELQGAVGNSTPLGTLSIASAASATAQNSVTVGTLSLANVTGTAAFNGAIKADTLMIPATVNNVQLTNTGTQITDLVEFKNSSILTLGLAGGTQTYQGGLNAEPVGGVITLHGTIATTNDPLTWGTVNLGSNTTLNSSGGMIKFAKTLDNEVGESNSLVLTAGTGDIMFQDAVGAGTKLGDVTIADANNVTATQTVNASSLRQSTGTGTTQLIGDVTTVDTVNLTTDAFVLHGTAANPALEIMVMGAAGDVKLNATNPNTNWTESIKNAVITTTSGSISDQVLTRVTDPTHPLFGAYSALIQSGSIGFPFLGNRGTGEIRVEVTDLVGSNFEITINWREGSPRNIPPALAVAPDFNSQRILATLPGLAFSNPATFQHLYTTPPDEVRPNNLIPVFVGITNFAKGTIFLSTDAESILVEPNGNPLNNDLPNGIQVTILVPFAEIPLTAAALPQPTPLPTPFVAPRIINANFEPPPQQPIEAVTFEAQTSTGVATETRDRHYELRIVSFDENGIPVDNVEQPLDLSNVPNEFADDEVARKKAEMVYNFNPSKLRDLFDRLPDDRYRLYLIEDDVERLMLDFVIRNGRPVSTSAEETSGEQDQPSESAPPDQGANMPVGTGASNVDSAAEIAAPARSQRSAHNAMPHSSFAERLGAASLVSHGGVVLAAAALARGSDQQSEKSADLMMARFGNRRAASLAAGTSLGGCRRRRKQLVASRGTN
jgi:hypothetical protein